MASPDLNDDMQLSKLFNVKGKVALVSGGGTGIGLMCVQALAVNGAKVYIVGRRKEKLDGVVNMYGKNIAGSIHAYQCDVTSKEEITKLVKEIESKEKCLNILINNAGRGSGILSTEAKSAQEMSDNLFHNEKVTLDNWVDTYKTNVPHCYFMTMAFLPLLDKATKPENGGDGNVVNISSISGFVKDSQNHIAYNATKASVVYLTRMMGNEIQKNGLHIRVNSIAPGIFPSELTAGGKSNDKHKSEVPDFFWQGLVPAQRAGTDQDMGNAILFLATNSYVNGVTIPVDGGYVLRQGI